MTLAMKSLLDVFSAKLLLESSMRASSTFERLPTVGTLAITRITTPVDPATIAEACVHSSYSPSKPSTIRMETIERRLCAHLTESELLSEMITPTMSAGMKRVAEKMMRSFDEEFVRLIRNPWKTW